jgi:hypothetical protein
MVYARMQTRSRPLRLLVYSMLLLDCSLVFENFCLVHAFAHWNIL